MSIFSGAGQHVSQSRGLRGRELVSTINLAYFSAHLKANSRFFTAM